MINLLWQEENIKKMELLLNEQSQAAMVVIEPSTGKVVGCVGRLGKKKFYR